MPECTYVYHVHARSFGGQESVLAPLELKLQTVVSHDVGVLGTKPKSTAREVSALNH